MAQQETLELTKGWVEKPLGEIVVVERGSSPRPIKSFLTDESDGVNWIKIGDAKKGQMYIDSTKEKITLEGAKKSRYVGIGDFILSNSMSFGLPYIMAIPGYIHDGWFVIRLPKEIDSNYFYYLLSSSYLKNQFQLLAAGGVVLNISGDLVKKALLPIAPIPEQKRIVEKLDSLLAQVGTIQQRLNNLTDIIKRFRQSVLAAAVSGKLTEQWRDKSNAKSWQDITFDYLVLESANGLSKRKGSEGAETTILRLADFKDAVRVNGKERKILLTEKEVKKYQLIENDLLVIRVNGSIELAGKFILYNQCSDVEGFCDHFIRFRVNQEKSLPKFLTFITNEGLGRRYLVDSLSTSAGQNTINQTSIKALKIKLPSIAEQTEIVRLVEQYFALADTLEKNLANAKQRVDNLTQSILAKAFRGELVPQDPNDEPADKLLARIKAARLEAEKLETAAKKAAKTSKK